MIMEMRHLYRQGLKKTKIAEYLNVDRKTVAKYLKQDLAQPERDRSSILDPYKDYIQKRLSMYPGLSAVRLCREIQGQDIEGVSESPPEPPYPGSERTVRRYVSSIRPRSQREYRPIETLPGEQAQVDWGKAGSIMVDGVQKPLYIFSFVLSYSRIRFVRFTTSQDMLNFLECHQEALQYIGGVPEEILYDNCKTVVSSRVGTVIAFNRDLLRFANRYEFYARACWVSDPESKGKVENQIGYVKGDFYYAREFTDLEDINTKALAWCDQIANEKTHGSTGEVPSARLAEEVQALAPLPDHPVPVCIEATRVVRKDNTFSFETNQYSVPSHLGLRKIKLLVYSDRLELYSHGELVGTHRRHRDRGRLVIDEDHYRDREAGPRKRQSRLQEDFEALGPMAPEYLRGLARERGSGLRDQVQDILSLREDYADSDIHDALVRATNFGKYSYGTIKGILQRWSQDPRSLPEDPRKQGSEGDYHGPMVDVQIRGPEEYARLLEARD